MAKGGRSYIHVANSKGKYKLYLEDVAAWHQIKKKKTPRLHKYDEERDQKWDKLTEFEFEPVDFSLSLQP